MVALANKTVQKPAGKMAALLLSLAMAIGSPAAVLADSDSDSASEPIKNVRVQVTTKLEAGSRLPEIVMEDGEISDGGIKVEAGGSKYVVINAEWVDKSDEELVVADEPRMKVTLQPVDVDDDYFLASYKASNVKISNGTFVSAKRDGDDLVVTLRVKGVKGEFDPPGDAWWNEDKIGEARWDKPENSSGRYEVQLLRSGKTIHKVSSTSSIQYNFYPYMTKEGEYTFQVRTVPYTDVQKKYGDESEWVESGELLITDRDVSDGKGQQSAAKTTKAGTKGKVGWVEEDNGWTYRYPSGDVCRGGWSEIDGYWYYFNMDGVMQTGWQQISGQHYYLHSGGQMAVGWNMIDGKWYYFHSVAEEGKPVGSMKDTGWQIIGTDYYYFNEDGSMYTGWLQQGDKWYYLNTLENSAQGVLFVGWFQRDGKTWFADSNGAIVTGWYQIDGNWHYFYPETGEMAQNTDIDGFYVGDDGVWR